MIILALVHAAVLRSADDVTPDTKQVIQPMQIYSKSRNRPTSVSSNIYVHIYRYPNITYNIVLESYKDKLSNKLHFIRKILDRLKVISKKPQVNQVVPYNYELVLHTSWVPKWCIYGYIWPYAAIYTSIWMHIIFKNIYIYICILLHLYACYFFVL